MLTSAAGIISLLNEPNHNVKSFALTKLNSVVNEFWPEIADAVNSIEELSENNEFPQESRNLASLVASKVHYHLGNFNDSLLFALGAGPLFDLSHRSEYVETTLAKCLDKYIQSCISSYPNLPVDEDHRLTAIVNRMFEQCISDRQYKQALGIALETRRMDEFRRAIASSDNQQEMCAYAFRVAMTLIGERQFRDEILRSLVGLYSGFGANPDYINMCQCLIFLDDAPQAANLLKRLSEGDEDQKLMAYQIGFDLYESATQNLIGRILTHLKTIAAPYFQENAVQDQEAPPVTELMKKHYEQLVQILSGETTLALQLQFLVRSNKSDLAILKQTKDAVRVTICHTGTVIANGFMHTGTTSDQFLRENLDWLSRATNWAKFTATASLGITHRGHEKEALTLLHTYLPREAGGSTTGYSEGGALYALGLIHANHGNAITEYLSTQLRDAPNEMIRHGGCLGVGLAAMGTARPDVYELLKNNLYQDDAVTGEAAGISMGLVMLGSMDQRAIDDMVSYAQETQHEKILRGLALGISFLAFGRLETADGLIQRLLKDKDALLRRAGVLSVAMAYCGSATNSAIQTLLKVAVSDTNDDVRRAAVIGLGFLLFRTPEQCPSVVSLLAESYNPHVRYGAALAIGIACAGSGNKDALALIEPLTQDPVNYVRQGALMASAMLLVQQTEAICPKVKEFRALYSKVINDKHDDVMAKFGAILAQGIIDAGGRNATVTLSSRTGHVWLQGAVGMLLFTHYWYWFPMSLCLGLTFSPSCIIAVNKNLEMPEMQIRSNAKPSTFAYWPPLEEKKKEESTRVATAILSVTARAKRREAEKAKESGKDEPMEIESTEAGPSTSGTADKGTNVKKDVKDGADSTEKKEIKEGEKPAEEEKKPEPEPNFEMLANPARVMKQQVRYIEMADRRWRPIKEVTTGGILVVKDLKPEEPITLVTPVAAHGPSKTDEEDEPGPPEPFEYNDADE